MFNGLTSNFIDEKNICVNMNGGCRAARRLSENGYFSQSPRQAEIKILEILLSLSSGTYSCGYNFSLPLRGVGPPGRRQDHPDESGFRQEVATQYFGLKQSGGNADTDIKTFPL